MPKIQAWCNWAEIMVMFFWSLQIKVCVYITKFKGKLSWRRALHQNKNYLRANQPNKRDTISQILFGHQRGPISLEQ